MSLKQLRRVTCDYCGDNLLLANNENTPKGWGGIDGHITPCSDVSLFSSEVHALDHCPKKKCREGLLHALEMARWAYAEKFDELVPAAQARREVAAKDF